MEYIKPYFLEEKLTISSAELELLTTKWPTFKTKKKRFDVGENYDKWMSYYMKIYRSSDSLAASFILYKDSDEVVFGANLEFSILSSGPYSDVIARKYEPIFEDPIKSIHICNDEHNSEEERSSILCTLKHIAEHKSRYLDDGKLVVQMKAVLAVNLYERTYPSALGTSLWERIDRDFVIAVGKKDDEKTEFKVHKPVLGARSTVFDRMLATDMKEKVESKLDIIDFDEDAVRIAIEFMYDRDRLDSESLDDLIDVLHFADKYDIADLKEKLEHAIKFRIYPDTICQIANASMTSNSNWLKDFCFAFLMLYLGKKIPFDAAETLDKDFLAEMVQDASMG